MSPPNQDPTLTTPTPLPPAWQRFEPFVPAEVSLRELTLLPVLVGSVLGMVFGASSLYLVLKVGMTVSASIPVAVISITLFRLLAKTGLRSATILENNIVQTAGSAGESIAFGLGVTMPAILILGFDLEITRVMLVAVLGGLLGILMMIPLRRALIVQQHGQLKYPEGTACAEVLKAGASLETADAFEASPAKPGANLPFPVGTRSRAAHEDTKPAGANVRGAAEVGGAGTIFAGFGIGLVYEALRSAFKAWKDTPEKIFGAPFKGGSIAADISPALLGVGYIIGPYLGSIMCGGGVLAYLVLIPAIKYFGDGLTQPLAPAQGHHLIRDMDPDAIRGAYVLYIGAGAVAAGGIISLIRSLPIIWHGIKEGLGSMTGARMAGPAGRRTDRDLSMKFVLIGILGLITAITLAPPLHMYLAGALLIVLFGFLFATVSSRLTGEIGSSSNPISGMTVATLLLTCLVFLALRWTAPHYYITALSVGGIVCIAASNAGTTSQDLKTGFLIGATPRLQQIAILIGAFGSALILGPILLELNQVGTVYVPPLTFASSENAPYWPTNALANLPAVSLPGATGPFRRLQVTPATSLPADLRLEPGDYLVDKTGRIGHVQTNFPPDLRAPTAQLGKLAKLSGPQAADDAQEYRVWQKTDDAGAPQGRYLVNGQGFVAYLVDPAINGLYKTRPDGSTAKKFDAPKAVLMSYIIKGILSRQLPWGLVLLGVMISIVLEMANVPSLAFAVGVYLPLASSSPIFVGGLIRWLVDRYLRDKHRHSNLTPEQLAAEGDKSAGVLLASGYIAGGAIAGIVIAFMAGVLVTQNERITHWAEAHNPFFKGDYADLLALIPFALLTLVLYLTGREVLFARRKQ